MRDAQKGRKSWLERLTSPPDSETDDQASEPESGPVHEQPRAPWADQTSAAPRPWSEQVREATEPPAEHPLFRPNQPAPAEHGAGAGDHAAGSQQSPVRQAPVEHTAAQHSSTQHSSAQHSSIQQPAQQASGYRPADNAADNAADSPTGNTGGNGPSDPRTAAAAAFAANVAPATGADPFADLANESARLPSSFEADPAEAAMSADQSGTGPSQPLTPQSAASPDPATQAPAQAPAQSTAFPPVNEYSQANESPLAESPLAESATESPIAEWGHSSEQSVSTNVETHGESAFPAFTPTDTSDQWQPSAPHQQRSAEHLDVSDVDDEPRVPAEPEPSEEERLEDERRQRIAELQHRWLVTQAQILDDPRDAVREAGLLIGDALQFLTTTYSGQRDRIERTWKNDDSLSTDELRDIMRRYRSLFQHVLSVTRVPDDR